MFKRGRMLLLGACLALAFFAGTWVSDMPAATSLFTPTPDDFDATAFVAGFTATAQAVATVAPFPPQDFLVLTDNANTGATASAQSIDPIYSTATFIVRRATQTEAYYKTQTANPIEPMYATATAIVAQATQLAAAYMTATAGGTMPALPPTIVPTLSDEESTDLLNEWTTTLEKAVGFSHPILDTIAYSKLSQIRYYQQSRNAIDKFEPDLEIMPVVTRINFGGSEYVALFLREPVTWIASVWIFRLIDDKPILLSGDVPFSLGEVFEFDPSQFTFKDFNENGLPDLKAAWNSGGNCQSHMFGLLEIQSDGSVVNVAKSIPGNVPPVYPVPATKSAPTDFDLIDSIFTFELVDVNQDGLSEVKTVGEYFDYPKEESLGCNFLPMVRYYGWDGKAYQDVTASLDESIYPEIDAYFEGVKQPDCLHLNLEMYQVVLDYYVLGRLQTGWARLAPQLHWELCSPDYLAQNGETMGKFLTWVGTLLDLEQQNIATP